MKTKNLSSREILQILFENGWYIERIDGSHHILKHPEKNNPVIVPHPRKALKQGTIRSIFKQAGLLN
ncbi:putative RNA binding protein YcfA (HicA-like mRNA interferase family) [Thermosediminibacter litoriperuensis]|uniref:Putative RNA binding protein YcfA (HicA-like mRNA interferase family) n=1 Tax=Thermosediminibacter litoriperuensis TaxID=291989 RepID=A0A5S5ANQ0_9FIRM|nr:putative RNA binding protein YcfA (HicA-like mRNA interferase family) [Thermosediminibacter litoriperuensis]